MEAHQIENLKKAITECESSSKKCESAQRDFEEKRTKLKNACNSGADKGNYQQLLQDAYAILGREFMQIEE